METVRNYGTVIYRTSTVQKDFPGTVRNYSTVKICGTNYEKTNRIVPYYMPWYPLLYAATVDAPTLLLPVVLGGRNISRY